MPIVPIFIKILTPFLAALDKVADDPNVRALIRSIARKCWDAMTNDPVRDAKIDVDVSALAAPDLTVEGRQAIVKDLNNPISKP